MCHGIIFPNIEIYFLFSKILTHNDFNKIVDEDFDFEQIGALDGATFGTFVRFL